MTVQIIDDSESILENHDWAFPVPIAYGPGRLAEIGPRCVDLGISNPLIVTDNGSHALPFIAQLRGHLDAAGLSSALFFDVSPNPRDDEISAGRDMYRQGRHDAIIAIGGGSAMDGGKAICLVARNDIDLWDFDWESASPDVGVAGFPSLITIPTTAGTGAETDSTAMITHVEKGMKFCICHPDLLPELTILDPDLTVSLPKSLTAWTGADAMVHAIEAYLVPGFDPLCDALALEGLSMIAKWLPVAVAEPDNLRARGGMLVGSCLAGIAFRKGLGMVHAISHMVGAEFNTQHGLTNAIVLPVSLRFNLPVAEVKTRRMAKAMELEDTSVDGFIDAIDRLLDHLEIPKSLGDIGVAQDCAVRIAEKAMLDAAAHTNPRVATVDDVRDMVNAALVGAR